MLAKVESVCDRAVVCSFGYGQRKGTWGISSGFPFSFFGEVK
jgi:hypothetical protein